MQSISLDQWLPIYPRECYLFTVYQNAALSIQLKHFKVPSAPYSHVSRDNWISHTTWRGHVFTNTCTCSECVQQSALFLWPLEDVTTIWLSSSQILFCYWQPFCCEIALKSIPQDLIDGKSTLVWHQAIAWTLTKIHDAMS